MRPQSPHNSPNWVDGMKITHLHFEQWEDAQLYRQKQSLALSRSHFNYGLSYLEPHKNQPLSRSANQIQVSVCEGVSQGGFPFHLPSHPEQNLSLSLEKLDMAEKAWYIVLKIQLFERQEAGKPDPEEAPPRLPFAVPQYKLRSAIKGPQGLSLSPNEVVLGRLVQTDTNAVELDDNYIPPCIRISGHTELNSELLNCVNELDEVVRKAESIMRKIQGDPGKHNPELANPLLHLSQWLVPRLIPISQNYQFWGQDESPVFFFAEVTTLARLVQSALSSRPERKKRELQLINYFIEGGMLDAKEAHSLEAGMSDFRYSHTDLRKGLEQVKYFTATLNTLFRKLDEESRYVWEKVNEHRIVINPKGRHIDG